MFKSEAGDGDILVGSVDSDTYTAVGNSFKQNITVDDDWNVSATSNDDTINVTGNNVTVSSGVGNDLISIGAGVSSINIVDLALDSDTVSFTTAIQRRSLNQTYGSNEVTLASDQMSIVLQNVDSISSALADYTVNNGASVSNVDDLIARKVINGGSTDVVFIFDKSGSMDTYISRVRQAVTNFAESLRDDNVDIRLGLIEYEDGNDIHAYAFTEDVDEFIANVNSVRTIGGTEYGLTAIMSTLSGARSLQFRQDADKRFIVLTDEDFDDGSLFDVNNVISTLINENVIMDVVGELGGSCQREWEPLATATGGHFYDINLYSYNGIFEDISGDIQNRFDFFSVDLSTIASGTDGVIVPQTSLDARENTIIGSDVEFKTATVDGDSVIGNVSGNQHYSADVSPDRQLITITGGWNVGGSDNNDVFNIVGDGVTVNGGNGNDVFNVGADDAIITLGNGEDVIALDSDVKRVTVTDLTPDSDTIKFNSFVYPRSMTMSNKDNRVTLANDSMSIVFDNLDTLADDYIVNNAGTNTKLKQLLAGAFGVDLSSQSRSGTGFFALPSESTERNAVFRSSTVSGDFVVGTIESGSYTANGELGGQEISVGSYWNVNGTESDDTIIATGYGATVNAGGGNDIIANTGSNVLINADDSTAILAQLRADDLAFSADIDDGTDGDDSIISDGSDVTINAGGGNDSIYSSGANVSIDAGDGNDQITVAGSSAIVSGGNGEDSITIENGVATIVFADLDTSNDVLTFAESIATNSLNTMTNDGGLILYSDRITLGFVDTSLNSILNYTVNNDSARNSIDELLYHEPTLDHPDAYIDLSNASGAGYFVINKTATLDDGETYYNASFVSVNDTLRYGGHQYQIFSDIVDTWEEAKAYAEALGGHLAIINDDGENDAIYDYMISQGYQNAYFGLSDAESEGVWIWIDGEYLENNTLNSHWGYDSANGVPEPNQNNENEDYGMFYELTEPYKWNDGDFNLNYPRPFIVEWDDDPFIVVGTVDADRNYTATSDTGRQLINVVDGWNVTASTLDDAFLITGTGSTISAGKGADSIAIGSGVDSITIADLDLSNDALVLTDEIPIRSLSSIEGDQLVLSSEQLTIALQNFSSVTNRLQKFTVNDAGSETSIAQLIKNPIGVNLSSAGNRTGVMTVDRTSTRANATLKSDAASDDVIVGNVVSSKAYIAANDSPAQSITVAKNWIVLGTDSEDTINITGTGATISGAGGEDSIVVGSNVDTITFADFDSLDAISFSTKIAEKSLDTLEDDLGVTLTSDQINLVFVARTLDDVLDATVDNGGSINSIEELIGTGTTIVTLNNPDAYIDLASASSAGMYVVDSRETLGEGDQLYTANFSTSTQATDIVVGDASADRQYSARSESGRQSINVTDGWNVIATSLDDTINITGNDSTVNGSAGADQISIGSGVSTITFAAFNTAEDSLAFVNSIAEKSLSTLEAGGNLILSSTSVHLTFENRSLEDVSGFAVNNGGVSNTIEELLAEPMPDDIHPTASYRVKLAAWRYGYTPSDQLIDLPSLDEDFDSFVATEDYAAILSDGDNHTLWGGAEGNDTLFGSDGYDEFVYMKGNGNDVIENAGDDDLINLLNVSLGDLDLNELPNAIAEDSTTLKFNDGGSIKVNGTSEVGIKFVDGGTFYVKDRRWAVK